MSNLADQIKGFAHQVGFDLVGIAQAKQYPEMFSFLEWIKSGYAADMEYITEKVSPRLNVEEILPEVKSIISCGVLYDTKRNRSIDKKDKNKTWISRYAWNKDYHFTVQKMLDQLIEKMKNELQSPFTYKRYVDTGPVLERVFAYHAGLGWFGKNSCLIHPKLGSYFFIGEILTDLKLAPDSAIRDYCGSCTKCIDACPTDAIVSDGVIDSRKCISYQTIENRGEIPESMREDIGHHLFGCDICQEVCPWNNKSPLTEREDFLPSEDKYYPEILKMLELILHKYPEAFSKSPLKRAKQDGLLRNLFIVIGNSGNPEFLSILKEINLEHNEIVNEARNWANRQIQIKQNSHE